MPGYTWRPISLPGRELTSTEEHLIRSYQNMRMDLHEIEELVGGESDLTEQDKKQLDKAVIVMRVGAKLMKRILRARGFKGKLKPEARSPLVQAE